MHLRSSVFTLALWVLPSFVLSQGEPDYTCGPNKPCQLGCCGNNNICGMGPDYCAPENCQSECNAKSECDPGWGSEWSQNSKCPLNVCCSPFGFCGTTQEFCGNNKPTIPKCSGTSARKRVVGYYEGWANTRACDDMLPENIPIGAYTHLNFAFAFVDPVTFKIAPMSPGDAELYRRFTGLKNLSPGLQTWIAIGGWSMNDPDQPTHSTFSDLAASPTAQNEFFKSLLTFMSTYGFDGVDIDWEYPVAEERSGRPADYANFVTFLRNLKNALGSGGHRYGLSITLPASFWYLRHFDIVKMEPIVDWFNIMSYDLHGTWDATNKYLGPYIGAHTNLTEIDLALQLLWRNSISPDKVVLGLGFYGRSFTLSDPGCTTAGCRFSGGGNPGKCSQSAGTLTYSEIRNVIEAGATVTLDEEAAVKNVVWDTNQWVSYDDQETIHMKYEYANEHCLGGMMVWAVSTDDNLGTAAAALSAATGRDLYSVAMLSKKEEPIGQCIWGECGKNCPAGLSPAQRSDGKNRGNAGIYNGCSGGQTRNYCCPSNDVPTCEWRGTAPFCGGKCHDEVEVASDTSATGSSCWTGHKVLCCKKTHSTEQQGNCHWEGSAPICAILPTICPACFYFSADCPNDKPIKFTTGKDGAGGEQPCIYNGGWKSFCCKEPIPYENCAWHQASGTWTQWATANPILNFFGVGYDCRGECPSGQVPIASDGTGCRNGGKSYFCCDNPNQQVTNPPAGPAPSICAVPNSIIPGSGQTDDGGNPDYLIEYYEYEDDCFIPGLDGSETEALSLSLQSSGTYEFAAVSSIGNTSELQACPHYTLEKRIFASPDESSDGGFTLLGAARNLKVCLNGPGPVRNQRNTNLRSQPYPPVGTIQNAKRFFSRATPVIACTLSALVAGNAPQAGVKYVTEHVYELQGPKQFIQSALDGVLPGGTSIGQTANEVLFDVGGAFKQTWTSLGVSAPSIGGATPEESLFSVLGTTNSNNWGNFLIADAKINSLKAIIWAGKQPIADSTFTKMAHDARIGAIKTLFETFEYLKESDAQDAFQHAYDGMKEVWQQWELVDNTFDWVDTFKDWNNAHFDNMVSVTRNFISTKLAVEVAFWNSQAALKSYTPAVVASMLTFAQNLQGRVNTDITIPKNFVS